MEMTIGRMKVGDKLWFGAYGVSNDSPAPILWLKGTPNEDFITQDVLDFLPFDAKEQSSDYYSRRGWGNPVYPLSNILSFLNSENPEWWFATHPVDAPPNIGYISDHRTEYESHFGFLYHFEDYETGAIVPQELVWEGTTLRTLIRLPSFEDILGGQRFKLFSKKGVRAHGAQDFLSGRGFRLGFDSGKFVDFWLSDSNRNGDYATIVSRSGNQQRQYPYYASGVRPVCTLVSDIVVEPVEDGVFRIKPSETGRDVFTDDELMALLGMARP